MIKNLDYFTFNQFKLKLNLFLIYHLIIISVNLVNLLILKFKLKLYNHAYKIKASYIFK